MIKALAIRRFNNRWNIHFLENWQKFFPRFLFKTCFICFIFCFLCNISVFGQSALRVGDQFQESLLGGSLSVFTDKTHTKNYEDILLEQNFITLYNSTLNLGFEDTPVWGRLVVENTSRQEKELILQFRKSFLDTLQLFSLQGQKMILNAEYNWNKPYNLRPYPDINPTFELLLKPKSKSTFYFKAVKNCGSWHLVPTVYDKKFYEAVYSKKLMLHSGILFGVFLLGFFFVFSFFVLSRHWIFLYYALYQLFFLLFYFSATEFFHYFLHDTFPLFLIDQFASTQYQIGIYFLYALFAKLFFGVNKVHNPFLYGFFVIFESILVVSFLSSLFFYNPLEESNEFLKFINFLGISLIIFILLCLFVGYKEKVRGRYSFTFAQTPIFLASIYWSLSSLGVVPKNQNFTFIFGLSFLAENILMLSVLAFQLRHYFKEKQKGFTNEMVEALENERNQIAMNLHDQLGGSLATVKRKIEDLIMEGESKVKHYHELNGVFHIVKDINKTLRRISHNLAPFELHRIGLVKALEQLCKTSSTSSLIVDFYSSGNLPKLSTQIEVNLYRIASEALQNVQKHAEASVVEVSLNFFERDLNLIIADNGSWKDTQKEGMGLKNIRLRVQYLNGVLNIDKGVGGTQMLVELNI